MVNCKTCATVVRLNQKIRNQQNQINNLTNEVQHYKYAMQEKNAHMNDVKYGAQKEFSRIIAENKRLKEELINLKSILPQQKSANPVRLSISPMNYDLLKLGNKKLI
jgi:hypothetical protein